MRYSLIFASFALAALAAPVPQAQPLALEKRFERNTVNGGRDVNVDGELNGPHATIKREPEAEPIQRNGGAIDSPHSVDGRKREPEAEPIERNGGAIDSPHSVDGRKREPEAEPIERNGGAIDSPHSVDGRKREPKAEPANQFNQPEPKPSVQTPGNDKPEDDLDLRSIYNSAVGIVEALKARGFSSDMLLDPK